MSNIRPASIFGWSVLCVSGWSHLRIIIGCVLLLVAAFALGTRLAEWDQEQFAGTAAGQPDFVCIACGKRGAEVRLSVFPDAA